MEKKYELLKDDTISINGHTLYRIRALRDFNNVSKGDLGGYIEKEYNLSHKDNCWVFDNARVYDNAQVCENARIYENAFISGRAVIHGNAKVFEQAGIFDKVNISDNVRVYGNAEIYDFVIISDSAKIYGINTKVIGDAHISNNANISDAFNYVLIKGIGSESRTTTFFKCEDGFIKVNCGCFNGTLEQFEEKVKETHGDNKYAKEYLAVIELIKIHFDL